MADAHDHYEAHLGPVYEWMAGPFEEACAPSAALFQELKLEPSETGIAIDLGSGHGLQATPLARLQFEVTAVDTCQRLLESLAARSSELAITTLQSDITDCWDQLPSQADLVICMGDTLTHLPSSEAVEALIERAASVLSQGGTFVTTFRDYVSNPLVGDQRFIPVRSDENRILTCFLEVETDSVRVHDLIHERSGGEWKLTVSAYPKLRLDPHWVASVLTHCGMKILVDRTERGMVTLVASF